MFANVQKTRADKNILILYTYTYVYIHIHIHMHIHMHMHICVRVHIMSIHLSTEFPFENQPYRFRNGNFRLELDNVPLKTFWLRISPWFPVGFPIVGLHLKGISWNFTYFPWFSHDFPILLGQKHRPPMQIPPRQEGRTVLMLSQLCQG